MSDDDFEIVDWVHFEKSRAELGAGFIRILSYFREDGAKSVAQIEEAMHDSNTAALVLPAVSPAVMSGLPAGAALVARWVAAAAGTGRHRRASAP